MPTKTKVKMMEDAAMTAAAILMHAAEEAQMLLENARIRASTLLETEAKVAKQKQDRAKENAKRVINEAIETVEGDTPYVEQKQEINIHR